MTDTEYLDAFDRLYDADKRHVMDDVRVGVLLRDAIRAVLPHLPKAPPRPGYGIIDCGAQ